MVVDGRYTIESRAMEILTAREVTEVVCVADRRPEIPTVPTRARVHALGLPSVVHQVDSRQGGVHQATSVEGTDTDAAGPDREATPLTRVVRAVARIHLLARALGRARGRGLILRIIHAVGLGV